MALYGTIRGFRDGTINPPPDDRLPPWAQRLHHGHFNLLESLVPLVVLMLKIMRKVDASTATAAMIFFFARVMHAVTYALGVPFVRPVLFTIAGS